MELDGGEAELFGNLGVLNRTSILKSHTTDTFGHIARRSNGRATSKSLELDVDNLARCLVDLDLKLHDITAGGCADETSADKGIGLVERSDVAGTLVVVNNLIIHCNSIHGVSYGWRFVILKGRLVSRQYESE